MWCTNSAANSHISGRSVALEEALALQITERRSKQITLNSATYSYFGSFWCNTGRDVYEYIDIYTEGEKEIPCPPFGKPVDKGNTQLASMRCCHSLPETGALPTTRNTRQSLKNTRQWHSAKKARQTVHRQSLLCQVLFFGHSAKRFAECQGALGKEKRLLRRWGDGDGFFAECNDDTRQRS
jgi:hypothetical protein